MSHDPIKIRYGKNHIAIDRATFPGEVDIFTPAEKSDPFDLENALHASANNPIGTEPLSRLVKPTDKVVIVTADGTRPVPNRILIPWVLKQLPTPPENVTVLLGNGGHRANTPEELKSMFEDEILKTVKVINHDAFDDDALVLMGRLDNGEKVFLNKTYVNADKRIALGLIEPHFFCGYSGGAKAVVPGVAGIKTLFDIHSAPLIADPMSTWGTLEENPIRRIIEKMAAYCPPDFLANVMLDNRQRITGIFSGDYRVAHKAGCEAVKTTSMIAVKRRYPVVLTCNCGYPLDQNIYQAVKGMSAAANITSPGGVIVAFSECADGFGAHLDFARIMQNRKTPEGVLEMLFGAKEPIIDQWQSQVLAMILKNHKVYAYTGMNPRDVSSIFISPISDVGASLREILDRYAGNEPVAVLPDGFQAVPFLTN